MEEIQEHITDRPDFGQHQFGGIGGPLSRSAQSGPAQPLGESLSSAFGGGFYLRKFIGSQSRGGGFRAEPRLRLFAKWQTGLWSGLNAANIHWGNRLVSHTALHSAAIKRQNAVSRKVLALQCVYRIAPRKHFVEK